MNILFLSENNIETVVGGVERVTRILADEFREKGNNVVCISSKEIRNGKSLSPNQFCKLLEVKEIDVVINQNLLESHYRLLKSVPDGIKVFSVLHNRPFQHEELGKRFKEISYPTTFKGRLMKLLGVKIPGFYISQRRNATRKNIEKFLDVSDKLFVLCEAYRTRILRFMPDVNKTKIISLPNPNTYELKRITGGKENLVLFVGRLENPQKNVTDFIDIWKSFNEENPDWEAKIIGDGPHRNHFEKYAKERGVVNLEFIGNSSSVSEYYSKAKLLCMTSLYEGWPMTLNEAISFNCLPVVYNTFEAATIILGKGNSDCLIQPFENKNFVKTLSYFANNDFLRLKTLSQIQNNIRQFSLSEISPLWFQILKS